MTTARVSGLEFYSEIPKLFGPLNDSTYVPLTVFNTAFGCPETNMGSSAEKGEITLGFPKGLIILFFRLDFKGQANTTYQMSVLAGGVPVRWQIEKHDPNGLQFLSISVFGSAFLDPVGGVPIQMGIKTKENRPGATILVRGSQFFIQSLVP